MVFNLTETVAVTQNFCDSHNFEDVYKDLAKDKEFKKGTQRFVSPPSSLFTKSIILPDCLRNARCVPLFGEDADDAARPDGQGHPPQVLLEEEGEVPH